VVVDQFEAVWEEAGDLVMARKCGRTDPDQITFFKSVGVAARDFAAARAVFTRGTKLEQGSAVSL
jgi:ornithine cyclodeaminase